MDFQPDYRNMEAAAKNEKPARLPLYEHLINPESMEKILDIRFAELLDGSQSDCRQFFEQYCGFYHRMTYDTVSYEVCVTEMLPDGGALLGERPGPIQSRDDFERYPWDDLPQLFWELAAPRFDMLSQCLPDGMKAVGGIGNGIFEISEDLVGFEKLCYMQIDDPQLFADRYEKIGSLLMELWRVLLERYSDIYTLCRIGDDMGFKSGTLLAPATLIEHVVPQYRRIISLIHSRGKPFLLHSCGKIFDVMEQLISAGIDAKHSNEDAIAPFDKWIDRYGKRIVLLGGIDTDRLCRMAPDDIFEFALAQGTNFRRTAGGYALGSGNSIPPYVPTDGYLAMIRAAQEIRQREA